MLQKLPLAAQSIWQLRAFPSKAHCPGCLYFQGPGGMGLLRASAEILKVVIEYLHFHLQIFLRIFPLQKPSIDKRGQHVCIWPAPLTQSILKREVNQVVRNDGYTDNILESWQSLEKRAG